MAVIFQPSAIMPPQVKALMKRSLRVNRRRKLNLFHVKERRRFTLGVRSGSMCVPWSDWSDKSLHLAGKLLGLPAPGLVRTRHRLCGDEATLEPARPECRCR